MTDWRARALALRIVTACSRSLCAQTSHAGWLRSTASLDQQRQAHARARTATSRRRHCVVAGVCTAHVCTMHGLAVCAYCTWCMLQGCLLHLVSRSRSCAQCRRCAGCRLCTRLRVSSSSHNLFSGQVPHHPQVKCHIIHSTGKDYNCAAD
jgi:hypothetical protein